MKLMYAISSALIMISSLTSSAEAQVAEPLQGVWQSVFGVDDAGVQRSTTALYMVFMVPGRFMIASEGDPAMDVERGSCLGRFSTADNQLTLDYSESACPDADEDNDIVRYNIAGDILTLTYSDGASLKLRRIGKPI